jgi:hypothetical protein
LGRTLKTSPCNRSYGRCNLVASKRYLAKDMQLEKLSVDFIEISTKWHDWLQKGLQANSEDCKEIIKKLDEIKHIVENR